MSTIAAPLRPDYYEWFPYFSLEDLEFRIESLPLHLATLLIPENILASLEVKPMVIKGLQEFVNSAAETQRALLREVFRHAGISKVGSDAVARVPREMFVPLHYRQFSYLNGYIPWDIGSCISPPGMTALMIDRLLPTPGSVLEIGIGAGYHAACVYELSPSNYRVSGYECNVDYAEWGRASLRAAGYEAIQIIDGDFADADLSNLSFESIYFTAAGPPGEFLPKTLLNPGSKLQYIRPLERAEFEFPGSIWFRQEFGEYEEYLSNQWEDYGCLETAVMDPRGGLTVRDRIYDVSFVPIRRGHRRGQNINFSRALDTLSSILGWA